ncbi:hypothetical protein ABL78_0129 [Leptomonas seymouri]|uniref:Uncharacterized protein n=1 Tax=Leptomonas seymouri TaxID=5684 RepID=A0A0N1PER0_LEPSE|nr:hypothetical protein ABL78_0129 [Leptomonas seymouri]|eukprot:KPI90693.1 hypothetical protein ABL78_0129 [Leptomonas seymouri]
MSAGVRTQRWSGASRRTYPPPACAFNPNCTVAVVSTIAGVRPFELMDSSTVANHHGPIAQSLIPPGPSQQDKGGSPSANAALLGAAEARTRISSSLHALWETPAYVATVAGESALIAVVFRARPALFTPPTYTMTTAERSPQAQKADAQPSPTRTAPAVDAAVAPHSEKGGEPDAFLFDEYAPSSSPADAGRAAPAELFASEAEYRRYVYLFDATTGLCLAALHFCGSPVLALRANAAVLLVVAADLFHMVELDALRYVRQQSMYKPSNPRAILDLSSAVPIRPRISQAHYPAAEDQRSFHGSSQPPLQYSYAVAFPQSARGYRGDVTVLTLLTTPRVSSSSPSSRELPRKSQSAPTSDTPAAPSPTVPPDAPPSMQQRTIAAHHHAVAHLRLRHDGRLLVTASELGTTLKIFDCATGSLLVELQRGHRPASVLSLGLQHDAHRVAALSANGTLHIFNSAAVVQSWEAGRRWSAPADTATTRAVSPPPSMNKARADYKLKITPLLGRDSPCLGTRWNGSIGKRGSPAPAESNAAAPINLPSDGSIHHEVGFAADGRSVWVAQVESTDTQLMLDGLQNAAAAAAGTHHSDDPCLVVQAVHFAGHKKRCVGKLTRFPVLPPGRTGAAGTEVEGVSFSIEV